ncbi:MAG: hypothetical protein A2751_01215 [Candidatus Doudnabacteria bacterium RIFCSPHIGHO2_01_FULL_46_14]|uniref:Uncharacterized protein n=1 Tax=Candidatus Doudnabacteria bacterium RIFCSPHIGHO2_01_FULL_46_14 TaxID=1817824 RepID=A0A1F5NME9_9BACT|nr:MAG: hypothetical protein A2751_01215 [Candidatus Doudnabacteria bacterium RIFCSPHIGHO2_01_FULL_46_14]
MNSQEAEEKIEAALTASLEFVDEIGGLGRKPRLRRHFNELLGDLVYWLGTREAKGILGSGQNKALDRVHTELSKSVGEGDWKQFHTILSKTLCPMLGQMAVKVRVANRS